MARGGLSTLEDTGFNTGKRVKPLEMDKHPFGYWQYRTNNGRWLHAHRDTKFIPNARLVMKRGKYFVHMSYNIQWRWYW